jgi:osmoprotectant transport system ATP-binding protein
MTHPIIASLTNVSQHFSNRKVLDALSLEFKEREITALLGHSGSGKSTILKLLNGMLKPDSGNVSVFGKHFDYVNANQIRLQIGYVVQSVGLFPHLTISQNIGLLGELTNKEKPEIKTRISDLMEMVQLPNSYLTKYPYQLSGGEQQRVGLCRAFFLKPPLVLMDEPFASLDYKTRAKIYGHLLQMQASEVSSVIVVTHQLEEAIHLCNRFYWIQNGSIHHSGDKDALKSITHEFKEIYL